MTLARDAVSVVSDEWVVALAESGPLERIRPGWEEQEWGQGLSAELSVWRVMLVDGEVTAEVVIDALSGSVYGSVVGIDN